MPNSNLRRMMMTRKPSAPSEDWDIDWKYTDGPLENFGWTTQGHSEMLDDGLHIFSDRSYYRAGCPVKTCKKAIAEYEFSVIKPGNQNENGLRLLLGNGDYGCQTWTGILWDAHMGILYNEGGSNRRDPSQPHMQLSETGNHFVRYEFDDIAGNKVFADGVLLTDTQNFSHFYSSYNSIFQQESGESVLKALRYKFIER